MSNFTPLDISRILRGQKGTPLYAAKSPTVPPKLASSRGFDRSLFVVSLGILIVSFSFFMVKKTVTQVGPLALLSLPEKPENPRAVAADIIPTATPMPEAVPIYENIATYRIDAEAIKASAREANQDLADYELANIVNNKLMTWVALREYFTESADIIDSLQVSENLPIATFSALMDDVVAMTDEYEHDKAPNKASLESYIKEFMSRSAL